MLRETTSRFRHVAIRASAGAGKTFQLTNRYLSLLFAGESADRILATTFTRKAAGEIMGRVLLRVAEAATDPAQCAELAKQLDTAFEPERAQSATVALVRQLHRLRICTLDSFFGGLAGAFGLELGLPPTWSIVEDDRDDALRARGIAAALTEMGPESTARLLRALGRGSSSQHVLSRITDVVTHLHNVYLEAPDAAWNTVHAPPALDADATQRAIERVASVAIRFADLAKARDEDVARATARDWNAFVGKGVAVKIALGETTYRSRTLDEALTHAYRPLVDHARAVLLGRIAEQTRASHALLEAFDRHYVGAKRASRKLRFDDVTRALARRADRGSLDDVYFRLDSRIAHLLLDEFQDTARMQWSVLRPFAEEVVAHGDESRSFFCVGDVKQAIYGWRGGDAEIFGTLDRHLPTLEWRPLDTSFRSSPAVIEFVNRVFGGIADNPVLANYRAGATRWAAGFEPHATARRGLPGYVQIVVAPAADDRSGQPVRTLAFAADRIAALAELHPSHRIGVLVRQNASVARLIFELRKRGVPASQEGGNPLTDSPAVSLILSLFALADHPGDTTARFHLATSPLGEATALRDEGDDAGALRVSRTLRLDLARDGYGLTVRRWVDRLAPHCDVRDQDRLEQLAGLAARFDADATLRVDDFVRRVATLRVDHPGSARVRVMTVHQAKGLEFDVVVLPEMDRLMLRHRADGVFVARDPRTESIERVVRAVDEKTAALFPEIRAMRDESVSQALRESLSGLYVALTRAIHAMHIVIAPSLPNERTLPSRWSGVLRGALGLVGPVVAESVPFEHGDPAWYRGSSSGSPAVTPPPPPRPVALGPEPELRTRSLSHVTPSDLTQGDRVDLAALLRVEPSRALARGSLLHAWLAMIEWVEDGIPTDARLRDRARALGHGTSGIDEHLREFRGLLEHAAVRAALTRGRRVRAEVRREEPFAVRQGNRILSGNFDRVVLARDASGAIDDVALIEFKTDRVPDGQIDARVDGYRAQVDAYRYALERITGVSGERIRAAVLFVTHGLAVPIA